MGHCGEFFFVLWATTVNLVVRYGPLWRIWFYTMGHWADLVMRYGSLWNTVKTCIDFCAMGQSKGFG
jgi:hypothetical protein